MTCIVGVVMADGRIVMGGDSAGVAGWDLTVRQDPKVFIKANFIFGFTSSFRMGQLLRYRFNPPDHDPRVDVDTYMRTAFIDELRKCFEAGGYQKKDAGRDEGGTFLVGYAGRLFQVEDDYQVGEAAQRFNAVGCGGRAASGAMHALLATGYAEDLAVAAALRAAESLSAGVRGPFVIETLQPKAI